MKKGGGSSLGQEREIMERRRGEIRLTIDLFASSTCGKPVEKSIQGTYGFLAGGGIDDVTVGVLDEPLLDVVFGSVFSSKIHSSATVEASFESVSFWNDKIVQNIGTDYYVLWSHTIHRHHHTYTESERS
jgi:hypothetical protein